MHAFHCVERMYTTSLSPIFLITAAALNVCVEGVMRPDRGSSNRVIGNTHSRPKTEMTSTNSSNPTIDIVFSDLDGTLIHYPSNLDRYINREMAEEVCLLPTSSTGMVGVISAMSLQLIRAIRQNGTIFVLVSGMRSSTLLKRLPYLPKADAYCCEDGGRIFYPTQLQPREAFGVHPKHFLGATAEDMHPFSLIEDVEWRKRMEKKSAAGIDGYVGNELNPPNESNEKEIPISDRRGRLWDFASSLLEKGFTIDSEGYCTCFRVNKKQQIDSTPFDTLRHGHIDIPAGLASSTNLGCIDFYPVLSGKKNCCDYLRKKFATNNDRAIGHCLCLCDDDNDIEMAMSCMHVYLPSISSETMEDCVNSHPEKFTVISTSTDGCDGIEAAERALSLVLKRLHSV